MARKPLACIVLATLAVCLLGAVLAGSRTVWRPADAGASPPSARPACGTAEALPATGAHLPRGASIEVADGIVTAVRWEGDPQPAAEWDGVLGSRYVRGDLDATDVTRALWRSLELVLHSPDGSLVEIHLLRPLWWLRDKGVEQIGDNVALSLPEMGVEGEATVLAIGACPADSLGDPAGEQTVIGTFAREGADVWDLRLEGQAGAIGVTGGHRFWSLDRRAWVSARDLRAGEALDGLSGTLRVARLERRPGRQEVYNLQVHREHVFRVGLEGVLVHNSCFRDRLEEVGRFGDKGTDAHHIVAIGHHRAEQARKVLRRFDIDLNDPINGVWLPRNSTVSRARGALHNEAGSALTSKVYLDAVNDRILEAAEKGRAEVLRELQRIRHDLLNGTFPGTKTIR